MRIYESNNTKQLSFLFVESAKLGVKFLAEKCLQGRQSLQSLQIYLFFAKLGVSGDMSAKSAKFADFMYMFVLVIFPSVLIFQFFILTIFNIPFVLPYILLTKENKQILINTAKSHMIDICCHHV